MVLRALLCVQAVLAVGVLVGGRQRRRLADAPVARGHVVGVAGALLWLVAVCALQAGCWRAARRRRGWAAVLALGAAAALAAWWPLWCAGPGRRRAACALLARGAGRRGAGAALLCWLHLRARAWQPADATARLAELQSRIRPHFLFNTLNTALALVRVDPARAEGVLEDLAELFRVALADAGASVALDEEVELAQRYLAIEQIRFGERLQVSWELDPRAGAARVPPLVLQPLVENAVRHGVEPAAAGRRASACARASSAARRW